MLLLGSENGSVVSDLLPQMEASTSRAGSINCFRQDISFSTVTP